MISSVKDRHRYRSIFFSRCNLKTGKGSEKKQKRHKSGPFILLLPKYIAIHKEPDRGLLLSAIERLHMEMSNGNTVVLDFTNSRKAYASGMLYLFAEVHNSICIYPKVGLKCRRSRNVKLNHVLSQIGLFKLCSHNYRPTVEYDDVVFWRETHGTLTIGSKFDNIITPDENKYLLTQKQQDIYGATIEATKNAASHAYIMQRELSPVDHSSTEWWMFSQLKDGILTVAVCDLGIGIPATLPITDPGWFKKIIQTLSGKKDAALIRAAIDRPNSRTGESHRGNGLRKIANIAEQDDATLAIFSMHGYVLAKKGADRLYDYRNPVPGTLIIWEMPMDGKNAQDN